MRRIGMGVCAILLALAGTATAAAVVVDYEDDGDAGQFNFYGDAESGSEALLLTDAGGEASGVFTISKVLDPSRSFKVRYEFRILRAPGSDLGDGFTFALLNEDDEFVGTNGSGLGYEGIDESFAVEVDTYSGDLDPIFLPHVAVLKNGDIGNHLAWEAPEFQIDGKPRFVWINYKSAEKRVSVFLSKSAKRPKKPLLTKKLNLSKLLPGGAFAGFTGGTGDSFSTQLIESARVTQK